MSGWLLTRLRHKGTGHVVQHVRPIDDLREHIESPTCFCQPVEDIEVPGLFVHNALDQRERYENEELNPQ